MNILDLSIIRSFYRQCKKTFNDAMDFNQTRYGRKEADT
jgi:hypothetical protein